MKASNALKFGKLARKLPLLAGVAAVATIGTMAVSTAVKVVANVEEGSTADKAIDFVSDVVVNTACIAALL